MNYYWLTYEEIEKAKYPNLLAEIKESGYSTSTLADFMGLGAKKNGEKRSEDDPEVWDKLTGKEELLASELFGIAKYYNAGVDYLLSHKLEMCQGKSVAYWRWYEENKRMQEDIERKKAIMEIYDELIVNSELLEFMKWCKTLTREQRKEVMSIMQKEGAAA